MFGLEIEANVCNDGVWLHIAKRSEQAGPHIRARNKTTTTLQSAFFYSRNFFALINKTTKKAATITSTKPLHILICPNFDIVLDRQIIDKP